MEIGGHTSSYDVTGLAASIQRDLNEKHYPPVEVWSKCTCRVPKLLREGKENAYTPMVVSIGPYHLMDPSLASMEYYKHACLKSFLTIHPGRKSGGRSLLDLCLELIMRNESRIRGFYADPIALSFDDFTTMVLLDSIFVIQFLKVSAFSSERPTDQGNSTFMRVRFDEIKRDLLLLENQLPLFIIDEICNISYNYEGGIKHAVAKFFSIPDFGEADWENCGHLLDVVRKKYLGSFTGIQCEPQEVPYVVSPTVTHLHAAGVKFKVVEATSLLDIKFDKDEKILSIPKLMTEDPTQSLFRNMIALEQCMYLFDNSTYITDYCYFLDCLINTPQDVQLLSDEGVVENWLGSVAVCDMFNAISKNARILEWNYTYSGLSEQLNNHCNRAWNRNKAILRNNYFAHPWAFISVVYAVVLLLLTVGQFILGILAVPGVLKNNT